MSDDPELILAVSCFKTVDVQCGLFNSEGFNGRCSEKIPAIRVRPPNVTVCRPL